MDKYIKIEKTCQICGEVIYVEVLKEDKKDWESGKLIQYAFPYLKAQERELLISGICGDCFKKMFNKPEF